MVEVPEGAVVPNVEAAGCASEDGGLETRRTPRRDGKICQLRAVRRRFG